MKKKIFEWFNIEAELKKAMAYPGFAFQVWCTINQKKVMDVLTVVKEKSTPSEAYSKFVQEADACKKKYYKTDENGNPIVKNTPTGQVYVFEGENKVAFEAEIAEIYANNKEVISEYDEMIREYYKYIQEDEIEIDIKLLNEKNVPTTFFELNPDKSMSFLQSCVDLIAHKEE
jgi:hypothetical protein